MTENGYLHIITGPMFSGKSSHIFNIINRNNAINISSLVIKHSLDIRYSSDSNIISHNKLLIKSISLTKLFDINQEIFDKYNKIIIDEAQFFDDIYDFVKNAVDIHKKHIIICGLNGDAERKPFKKFLELIPLADKIDFLQSYCYYCKDETPGIFSLKYNQESKTNNQILIGSDDYYHSVCRKHYLDYYKK